jgi:hypothetical protein
VVFSFLSAEKLKRAGAGTETHQAGRATGQRRSYSIFGIGVTESTKLSGFFLKKKPSFTVLEKSACIPKMLLVRLPVTCT